MSQSDLKPKRVWHILIIGIGIIILSGFSIFIFQGWAVVSTYGVEFPLSQELIDKWNIEHFPTAIGGYFIEYYFQTQNFNRATRPINPFLRRDPHHRRETNIAFTRIWLCNRARTIQDHKIKMEPRHCPHRVKKENNVDL